MGKEGILSLVRCTDEELTLLIEYLTKAKSTEDFEFLFRLFNNPHDFLKFVDLFSGTTIRVPTREEMFKLLNYIKIYNYCNARNRTEEAYQQAAKIFERKPLSVVRIVEKIDRILSRKGENDE